MERQIFWHFCFRFPATWDLESDPEEVLDKISLIFAQKTLNKQAQVNSFVFMYDHVHALVSSASVVFLDGLIEALKSGMGIESYYFEKIENRSQLSQVYRYIYRNPIEMGFCSRAQDYPYSSLNWLLGFRQAPLAVVDQFHLMQNPFKVLKFIESEESVEC